MLNDPKIALPAFSAVKYDWLEGRVVKETVGKCFPIPEQDCWGNDITSYLNKVVPEGGRWRCVLLDPKREYFDKLSGLIRRFVPQKIELQWLDKYDAPVIVIEVAGSIFEILEVPYRKWADDCLEAHRQVDSIEYAVGITDKHILRVNQGQTSIDPTQQPVI